MRPSLAAVIAAAAMSGTLQAQHQFPGLNADDSGMSRYKGDGKKGCKFKAARKRHRAFAMARKSRKVNYRVARMR
jgi:hypothetical protein